MIMTDEQIRKELGNRIRLSRLQRGMSQEKLADAVGRSNQFISSLERGHQAPSVYTLAKICEVLPADADYILMGRENNIIPSYVYRIASLPKRQQHQLETYINQLLELSEGDGYQDQN